MSRAIAEQSRFSTDYHFAATHPGVLRERPTGAMNRAEMHRRMNERCALDPGLRQSLFDHPRAIYAVAVEECFGLHRSLFFVQISHVEVIAEDEVTLGVVLPACHLGCVAPRLPTGEEQADSQCHICSHRETTCHQVLAQPALTDANRDNVRTWIQNRAKTDASFREHLIASPSAAWSQMLGELKLPVNHPLNKIHTMRLLVESAETIGFVLEWDGIGVSMNGGVARTSLGTSGL
jgi:hypothetical protein